VSDGVENLKILGDVTNGILNNGTIVRSPAGDIAVILDELCLKKRDTSSPR